MREHTLTETKPTDKAAYLANGLIGLRIGAIPMPRGTALVNGFVGHDPERRSEAYAEAPYPVGADVELNGLWLSERPDLARFERQTYDFSCGELRSRFVFAVNGVTAVADVLTFCSRTQPTIVLQEIAVETDADSTLVLRAHVDPRGIEGRLLYRCRPGRENAPRAADTDGILQWGSRGDLGSVGVSYLTQCSGGTLKNKRRNDYGHEEDWMLTDYTIDVRAGERCVLRQFASMVPGIMHGEPHWQASRLVVTASWWGFDQLRELNRAAWAELWKGRVNLVGAGQTWQDAADAAFFYVHSSVSPFTPCSVAPFGLSRRAEYQGHVFWDTETFMFPPVLLTNPAAARAMLDYRSRLLQAARFNAMLSGHQGIQFPWQSGNTGSEVTSYYCEGQNEHHINMDVAFAFAQYAYATDDGEFQREQAWPVLKGVAEWIVSRVERTRRGYEIRHIVGIDESINNIHNNSLTNMLASLILREAALLAEKLGFAAPARWGEVADRMFVPVDPVTHVIMKHDSYKYESGMCVPETLSAFFPFTCDFDQKARDATFRYHMNLARTYIGMPMLSTQYGVWAARMCERKLALEFFEAGVLEFLHEPYLQTSESSRSWRGMFQDRVSKTVFLTNPAGFLMACMIGLTGIRLDSGDPRKWGKLPVVLPEGWDAIEVERIQVRGGSYALRARHGDKRAEIVDCHFAGV